MKYDFPKIDLHCHLDGAICAETMFELARERNIPMKAENPKELEPYIMCDPNCTSVNDYLTKFDLPTQILQDRESLARVAYELIERSAKQGLGYIEIRFAPQLHVHRGLSQGAAIEAVEDGVRIALKQFRGINAGIILCAMCIGEARINREANLETAHLAVKLQDELIRGFDLAGAEGVCPLSDFAELFDIVREGGVPFTCHAGDSQGADTVRTAICEFGSERIGHGHHIIEDEELCKTAAENGVTLEICLTSNIQCGTQASYEEHPIKRLFDMGVRTTLNTDNPMIAGVTLDSEYDIASKRCGLTYNDIVRMNIYAAECSFMCPDEKAEIIARLRGYLK
ncbi:MAG: adenosine deaminase [Oscillospiraceae bacterium]